MSLTEASEPENMQVKINSSDKQSKNGDEQIEGMSVSDAPEFKDPAILLVRESVKVYYSRDELVKLRDVPLSRKRPDFLTISETAVTIFETERWGFERKKSDTPTENGPRTSSGDAADHRRRPGDPRERIRKENDGIVLSPQRRSFNSGCFVPVRATARTNRPPSPLGPKNEPIGKNAGVREIQTGTRRIGSGRILRDSWDFNEKPETAEGDFGFRGPQRSGDRDEKYDRRSFGRDFEMNREVNNKEGGRRNGRYDRRRISENWEQEEPEWFSGGPISQTDTIELRGFEEHEKPTTKKKVSPSKAIRNRERWKKKSDALPEQPEEKEESKPVASAADRSTPQLQGTAPEQPGEKSSDSSQGQQTKQAQSAGDETESKAASGIGGDQSFNFDDILKCDTIPGLLTNGVGGDGDNMKSRFSRWFKQESPEKHDDHHIIKDLLNDIGETSVSIPGDSNAYFAPISPAASNASGVIGGGKRTAAQQQSQSISIMEMLQKSKQQQQAEGPLIKVAPQLGGKILSLDELEAKMRQTADASVGGSQKHHPKQKPDEEMTAAFKKLLAQAQTTGHSASSNGPMNKTQPMSLLEMLNHSQQQDEAARMLAAVTNPHLAGAANPNLLHHAAATELSLKLQQVQYQQQQKQQMEMLNKLSRELLSRPEAQAILQGLKRGEITTQHLYQQLANPALQPRHREMLVTILKIQGGGGAGYGPSPRVLSPVPPHHMFQQAQQQQQQLRVSPLPPSAYCVSPIMATSPNTLSVPAMHQRIPSPRELQVHTQNILQRALIKKKLEEQQENYRKKQEMQRGQSPNAIASPGVAKSVSSPTPLAFTPTSVLRKMTADKDEGKENKAATDTKVPPGRALTGMRPQPQQLQPQQWNAQFGALKQPGRPIVKANNNYQTQTPEQFFSQQQQRMFGHQSQVTSQQAQQQQQRKPNHFGGGQTPGGSQSSYSAQYSTNQQFTQQLTQQQLRAQHQHRPTNQQPMGFQSQQQSGQQIGAAWQQFFNSAQASRGANPQGRGVANDGDLSPTTTNQLARWFSPDLLERARGGELPSTAGLAQHALSLEDVERQAAPPVHN